MSRRVRDGKRLEGYLPPEGVPISFSIASIGARFGAQVLDIALTYGFIILLVYAMVTTGALPIEAMFALIMLCVFLIRVPYYILAELVWNGRTVGKRIVGIRVINAEGRRLTPHQIVARNLMKEVELFTPVTMVFTVDAMSGLGVLLTLVWVLAVLIVPLANRRRQRLGDMVAGTIVVDNPRNVLLPDLALSLPAQGSVRPAFDFLPAHLDIYGRFELQTLEKVLRDPVRGEEPPDFGQIARTIIRKIGYADPVRPGQERAFLNAFYRAQREHLETLRLFGNRREDKFHSAPGS